MIDYQKPVRVFKNPVAGCYNIMQGGLVRASAKQIRLRNVEFLVRESGRQRMLRSAKRNVHAYVAGELLAFTRPDEEQVLESIAGRHARYNPHRYSTFVDAETEQALSSAELVQLDERGVTYC